MYVQWCETYFAMTEKTSAWSKCGKSLDLSKKHLVNNIQVHCGTSL